MNNIPPTSIKVSPTESTNRADAFSPGSQLEQQRQVRLQTIQALVQMRVGDTVEAVIEKVVARPVAPPLTNQIMNQTTSQATTQSSATSITSASLSPGQLQLLAATRQQMGSSLLSTPLSGQQQTPAQTAVAQLNQVDLRIAEQKLSVLTPLLVKAGDRIAVTLTPAGELKLQPNTQTTQPLRNTDLLTNALREALPLQRPAAELLQQLKQITSNPVLTQALLSNDLRNPVQQLLNQALSANRVTSPDALRQTLNNSGIQFERKLHQQAPAAQSNPTSATSAITQDLKGQLLNLKQQLETHSAVANAVAASAKSPANSTSATPPPTTPTHPAQTVTYNPEGRLLDNSGRTAAQPPATPIPLAKDAPTVATPATGVTPQTSAPALNPHMASTLPAFTNAVINLFAGGVKQAGEFDVKQLRTQLTVLLHRQLLQTLASITSKQATSLSRQQVASDTGTPLLHWNMELPLRMGEHVIPLYLTIEEKEHHEPDKKTQNTEKVRRWEVRMSFELPEEGNLHAHIRVINDNVSASLWAEQASLLAKAKEQITSLRSRLERSGVVVDNLDCQQGTPPTQATSLGYALVDIKT